MANSTVRVVFRPAAFRELRTSAAAVAEVASRAESVAASAGDGFEVLPMQAARNRAHAVVAPTTFEAAKRNAEENTLLRSLDAGR